MVAAGISACGSSGNTTSEKDKGSLSGDVSVIASKGAGAESLSDLGSDYKVKTFDKTDSVISKIKGGDYDAAIVSANTAAQLYNETDGEVIAVSPVVLGDLYVLTNGLDISDQSMTSLRGRTITACCKNETGEYALEKLLKDNYVNPEYSITFDWVDTPEEVETALKEQYSAAVLQEPYVSQVLKDNKDVEKAIDLNSLWYDSYAGNIPTDVLVVSKSFAEKRSSDLKIFLSDYGDSLDKAKKTSGCDLVLYSESNRGTRILKDYYKIIYDFDADSLGGSIPGNGFYYNK